MGITENAAYLNGLFDGYELDTTSKECKIIKGLLELVSDMADKIKALEDDNKELHEYIEELDHDLGELEEEVYLCDDECDCDCDDCDCDCDCDDYSDLNEDEEFAYDDDEEFYEVECPHCGETICFGEELTVETLVCPACGERIDTVEEITEE